MMTNDTDHNKRDLGLLFLRAAGLVLCFTFGIEKIGWLIKFIGSGKPWNAVPLAGLIRNVGFPFAPVLALFAILCESLFALFVALGIYTRIFSILIAVCMIGALYTSIRINDPLISKNSAMEYIIIFGTVAILGPGKFTIGRGIRLVFASKKA
ncbi:MAG TPA: DoxX family protein [Mucilaginibacter sp.]|nr:DoxX family protein [Mucilaginibacter sp.]